MGFGKRLLKHLLSEACLVKLRALDYRWHSTAELLLLSLLCNPGKCSVDTGANLGVFTYYLARYSAHVYAYEPNPELTARLQRAFTQKVTVIQAALSDLPGSITLKVPSYRGQEMLGLASVSQTFDDADEVREFTVPRRRLDDEGLTNVGFVKIDVEQHEEPVLRGSMRLLEKQKPNILLEVTPKLYSRPLADFLGPVLALGYRGYFIYDGILMDLKNYCMDQHNRSENYGVAGKYVTNVVLTGKPLRTEGDGASPRIKWA